MCCSELSAKTRIYIQIRLIRMQICRTRTYLCWLECTQPWTPLEKLHMASRNFKSYSLRKVLWDIKKRWKEQHFRRVSKNRNLYNWSIGSSWKNKLRTYKRSKFQELWCIEKRKTGGLKESGVDKSMKKMRASTGTFLCSVSNSWPGTMWQQNTKEEQKVLERVVKQNLET